MKIFSKNLNKYYFKQKIGKRIEPYAFLPLSIRYMMIKKNSFLNGEEILLDSISQEKLMMWFFKNSDIGYKHLYRLGHFEAAEIKAIKQIVKPGDIVFDVGANIGYHALIMSHLVGKHGEVFAFEPFKKNTSLLKKNVEENSIQNMKIFQLALGKSTKKIRLKVYKDYAYNSLLHTHRMELLYTEFVDMKSVDEFLKEQKMKKVDFIKIDVEGYELEVLKGARKTLLKYKPKIICEISLHNLLPNKIKPRQIVNFLFSLGYKGFLIKDTGFTEIRKDMYNPTYFENYYFY